MILLILGFILGIFNIIPTEWFNAWQTLTLIEFAVDVIVFTTIVYFHSKNAQKRAFSESSEKVYYEEEKLLNSEFDSNFNECEYKVICSNSNSVDCIICNNADRFTNKLENPYVKDTVRYRAWEANHNV